MKNIKYLNAVLTVIAACLILITLAVTGLIPKANAKEAASRFAAVPVNTDGSITVRLAGDETMDVNINEISGLPVTSFPLPTNITQLNGAAIGQAIPVETR